jgi:hypothetical protein
VLRRILAGGLMTAERASRHRKDGSDAMCACGLAEATVEHISWQCGRSEKLRKQVMRVLPKGGNGMPTCTRYAAVIPTGYAISVEAVAALQGFLVEVWLDQIRRWHNGDDLEDKLQKPDDNFATGENGHRLERRVDAPGLWCRKCGKFTARVQHVRLKITKKPCQYKELPEEKWLQKEGHNAAEIRLDLLAQELEDKYNQGGHKLEWNRLIGKTIGASDEGKIDCSVCKRTWRWKDRVNNLPKSKCRAVHGEWVANASVASEAPTVAPPERMHRRLRSKTPAALAMRVEPVRVEPSAGQVDGPATGRGFAIPREGIG